jgi:hypothetical protein
MLYLDPIKSAKSDPFRFRLPSEFSKQVDIAKAGRYSRPATAATSNARPALIVRRSSSNLNRVGDVRFVTERRKARLATTVRRTQPG